jgi:DNA helicase HerA-like ATPase
MVEWDTFALYQLTRIPRGPEDPRETDPVRSQLFAALTACYATLAGSEGACLMTGWLRPPGAAQISFVVGGTPSFPPAADSVLGTDGLESAIFYPPGARGTAMSADGLGRLVDALPFWVACAGQPDTLWLDGDAPRDAPVRSSFDDFVAHLRGGFGWIVLVEPVGADVIGNELAELAVRIPTLRKRESSEQHRLELQRAEGRYRELAKARVTGMWTVRLLVGAAEPDAARSAAALLCSAGELEQVPYALIPGRTVTSFDEAAGKPLQTPDGARSPFMASSELVLALARPPARELPGIRTLAPPCFDVTPEAHDADGVVLGHVLDHAREPAGTFTVPYATLNRHAFVCGATGSGKSQTMRTLLDNLARDPKRVVPWLVIEPAKAEYARMAGRLCGIADVTVIRPGDPDVAPASLNPLEPEPGFPLQSHADLVRALFLAAFEANEPFPQVLSQALTRVYVDAGWDLVTGEPRPATKPKLRQDEPDVPAVGRYPTLGQLQHTASAIVEEIGYGKEVTADVRGFVDVRMGSLRQGTPGRFFEGGHPLDIGALLERNVVLELEDITSDQDKAFLIGAVLIRIVEHLRVRATQSARPAGLRHLTVVEEAHRLLKNVHEGPAAAAVELFAALLAEIRSYGEGVVVVEQIPAKILPDVIKNSALKIVHRLPALDDREAVGGTMNLQPEQSELVVAFEPGVGAAAVDGMDRPVMVRVPNREFAESDAAAVRLAPLGRPRSPLCTDDCSTTPCTLRMINEGEHRSRDARLTVWVETVVISFLVGEPPPQPSPALARSFLELAARDRHCSLVHALDRSIVARRPLLTPWFDPDDFAAHALRALERLLRGDTTDEGDWRRWTAGFFRWGEIRSALRSSIEAGRGGEPPHPDTSSWAVFGMPLDAPSIAEQFEQLRAHPSYADGRERLLLGDVDRSHLRTAIRELAGTLSPDGITRALYLSCVGHRPDLIEPRIGPLLRES